MLLRLDGPVSRRARIGSEEVPNFITQSLSYPIIKNGSNILAHLIPDSFYRRFEEICEDISNKTVDERFIDNSIKKLKRAIKPKDLKIIDL